MRFIPPMMASGKNAKKNRKTSPIVTRKQGLPWLTIGAVGVILLLAGGIFAVVLNQASDNSEQRAGLEPFIPGVDNQDPSVAIPDIYVGPDAVSQNNTIVYPGYKSLIHIEANQRVDYDRFPPVGGPHDGVWARCDGAVYDVPVRNESMVHPLEHGAIWIAYNPATISAGDLDKLKERVVNKDHMLISPYTDLDRPIALQSWGHQLKVDSADDERINQFITALKENVYITPEVGGRCDQPTFSLTAPPALDTSAPSADAVPMDGGDIAPATDEELGGMGSEALSTDIPGTELLGTDGIGTEETPISGGDGAPVSSGAVVTASETESVTTS